MVEAATLTFTASTGNQQLSGLTALPQFLILTYSQKNATDNVAHFSQGFTDGTVQRVDSTFADTTGAKTVKSTAKVLSHYERVAGTITEVIAASFVSFDNLGGGSYGFTLNFTVATGAGSYQLGIMSFS